APLDPLACGDSDADGCDDCTSGVFDPANDGADSDGDGQCNANDPDQDGDGTPDADDPQPANPFNCGDSDGDFCDDCAVTGGPGDPSNDGVDADADGLCDLGDFDDDNDGVPDFLDFDPKDPNVQEDPIAAQEIPNGNNTD